MQRIGSRQAVRVLMIVTSLMMTIIVGFGTQVAAETTGGDLEKKIADMTLLQDQLAQRAQQASALAEALSAQKDTLLSEIAQLRTTLKIKTFPQASRNPRLRYDLKLVCTLLAYLEQLQTKIRFYELGKDRLAYLNQLAADDMRMLATVNELKTDALTTQISLVVNKYLPEAHVIVIDPQKISLKPPEAVWNALISGHL